MSEARAIETAARFEVYQGDCLDVMRGMAENSVDAVVTDPPYGLSFMGKKWDHGVPGEAFWAEALRVAKPGVHMLAFCGTRTFHRLACAIEDSGWEIRDCIMWVYGSGFPKSLDVSKAIDKAAGAERDVVGPNKFSKVNGTQNLHCYGDATRPDETAPATAEARQWAGWGTALKPAWEPVIVARKPLARGGIVAANVLLYGTGGLNVDGCRVGTGLGDNVTRKREHGKGGGMFGCGEGGGATIPVEYGRWPANLIHDGSAEVVGLLKDAARFFYCAKASKSDRDDGCEGFTLRQCKTLEDNGNTFREKAGGMRSNHHPTVKPTALMRYLCRLVTPPDGLVLDPFMGSGSTGKGALLEGFRFIGIEREAEYCEIGRARLAHAEATETQGELV